MRIRQRINRLEKVSPTIKTNQEENELERICCWLAQHSEEFVECVRQIFRLQYKAGQHTEHWERWQEPYKHHAHLYINRINELIQEHRDSVNS